MKTTYHISTIVFSRPTSENLILRVKNQDAEIDYFVGKNKHIGFYYRSTAWKDVCIYQTEGISTEHLKYWLLDFERNGSTITALNFHNLFSMFPNESERNEVEDIIFEFMRAHPDLFALGCSDNG